MEKELLELLRAKFAGAEDVVLLRQARKLAKDVSTEDQAKQAVDDLTVHQLYLGYADSRAEESSRTSRKNAIREYEERYGLKDGVKVAPEESGGDERRQTDAPGRLTDTGKETTDRKPEGGDDNGVLKYLERIEKRLNAIEGKEIATGRRQTIEGVIGKLPKELQKPYELLSFEGLSEEEFSSRVEEISGQVDTIMSTISVRGSSFGKPFGGEAKGGNAKPVEVTDKEADALLESMNI